MDNSKIRIFILGKDKVNWSIDQDRKAVIHFLNKNNFEITRNIFKATHIFCVWHVLFLSYRYCWLKILKKFLKFKIIAVITNDITFNPEEIEKIKKYVDIFIAPSNKIYNFLQKRKLKSYKIPFFVDAQLFKPLELSKQEICRILNIDYEKVRNKILIGSFQRDSLGKDLSKPKWQKNPDLLIKILKKFSQDRALLILAGPRRHYLINKCREYDIPYLFYGKEWYIDNNKEDLKINNLENDKISLLYNLIDIYIITSKSEGGPKAVLEAGLTKTFITSTNVGCAPDILHRDLIYNEAEIEKLINFLEKISEDKNKKQKYIDYNYKSVNLALDDSKLLEKYKSFLL